MRRVRVFHHDKCFDGAASAALFAAFYARRVHADTSFEFCGLTHKATALFDPAEFTGDDNAIVDFKYCPDPRVTWWFDHHQSAFLNPADAARFNTERSSQQFCDPAYRSCTELIADMTREHFGFDPAPHAELIRWADRIDGAVYESAASAVALGEPAMQLTLAIEGARDPGFLKRVIPDLATLPLSSLVAQPYVQAELQPLLQRHRASLDIIARKSDCRDGVVFFDVSDEDLEGYNKFVPYFIHPGAVYNVGLSRSSFRMKVSVGSNPWNVIPTMENLAAICERYGGGGHARVGAISFLPEQHDRAREVAHEIVAELRHSFCQGAAARVQASS